MMSAVDGGEVGCVIVRDFSRICRNYLELDNWFNAMADKGVRLIAVNDRYDSFQTVESGQFR
jgi:DNA invertase Pin-like site-specific DNA recombinase